MKLSLKVFDTRQAQQRPANLEPRPLLANPTRTARSPVPNEALRRKPADIHYKPYFVLQHLAPTPPLSISLLHKLCGNNYLSLTIREYIQLNTQFRLLRPERPVRCHPSREQLQDEYTTQAIREVWEEKCGREAGLGATQGI